MKIVRALLIGVYISCAPATTTSTLAPSMTPQVLPSVATLPSPTLTLTPASPSPTAPPAPTLTTNPREAVLALADLPSGCSLTGGRNDLYDVISSEGYIDGWLVFYACNATPSRNINLMAEATTYSSAEGAKSAVAAARAYWLLHPWNVDNPVAEVAVAETIGDMSFVFQDAFTNIPDDVGYTVMFVSANMSDLVSVQGPRGFVDLPMVLALAKKQLARAR